MKLKVIIGNPPYSIGQKSANDNNQNPKCPLVDNRIKETYAALSNAKQKGALYDAYIRAFRWASDRIQDGGIVGFITNRGWLDGMATAGVRACFEREFDEIYVYDLRGGNRGMNKEQAAKEGENVFPIRVGVCIAFLVKLPPMEGYYGQQDLG